MHQDGLVHISHHLADKFIKEPAEVVSVQQKVKVTVLEVDIPRKRIALSMKNNAFGAAPSQPQSKGEIKREKESGRERRKHGRETGCTKE
ncbi:MAG: S1 RNA-binding domain-containing protein [Bacteroidota bacterium]